jgi:hypothetical protein
MGGVGVQSTIVSGAGTGGSPGAPGGTKSVTQRGDEGSGDDRGTETDEADPADAGVLPPGSQRGNVAQLSTTLIQPGVFYSRALAFPERPDVAEVPFRSLDVGIQPEEFPGFFNAASELLPGSATALRRERLVDTGSLRTGTSTLVLEGTLSKDLGGNVTFVGAVSGKPELYNFDKPGLANAVGRHLVPGRPFLLRYVGRREVGFPR